jgi:hypothetical protein
MAHVVPERLQKRNGLMSVLLICHTMERTAMVIVAGSLFGNHENNGRVLANVGKNIEILAQETHHSLTPGVWLVDRLDCRPPMVVSCRP